MRWSWRLLTLFGIGIYVHVTFLLLLIWAGWSGYALRQQWIDALGGIGFILTLFAIVVLHELGHALMARRFGIGTRDITLLPIGGVARLERMPRDPKQELAVALAGPAVNLGLALIFLFIQGLRSQLGALSFNPAGGDFVTLLIWVNLILAGFNLLPAFPMDGGRVLRALMATRMPYLRATQIAGRVGQGMAVVFGIIGIFATNPFLILIAVFVWMGAAQEASVVEMKSALGGTRVEQVMITDFRALAPEDTLARAVEFLLAGYQQDFPVVSGDRLAGLLTRAGLVNGLARMDSSMPVADAMEKDVATATPDELVEDIVVRLQNSRGRSLPVLDDGMLRGIVTSENVGEYLMIQAALQQEPRAGQMGARMAERHA